MKRVKQCRPYGARVAYHEAGHAIIAHVCERQILKTTESCLASYSKPSWSFIIMFCKHTG
jgi:hypothetical protein